MKTSGDELHDLFQRSRKAFLVPIRALLSARVSGSRRTAETAKEELRDAFFEVLFLSDMLGRRRTILEARAVMAHARPEDMFSDNPLIPRLSFEEAVLDLTTRYPELAVTAGDVARLYQTKHVFAMVESADIFMTEQVQKAVARLYDQGVASVDAKKVLAELGDMTESYASTVYRTNLNTAYTAGRFQQAMQPAVRVAVPAMQRFSVRDSALRRGRKEDGDENHEAAHGLIADTLDPIWKTHSPPSGYNCRCSTRMVSHAELRRLGLLEGTRVLRFEPPGLNAFRAHPNFTSSPRQRIYGG